MLEQFYISIWLMITLITWYLCFAERKMTPIWITLLIVVLAPFIALFWPFGVLVWLFMFIFMRR